MPAGRPRKRLDLDRIKKLASMGLTVEEIAVIEECNKKTIERRQNAMNAVNEGRAMERASLKRKQHEVAMAGNPTMLIWLGKQRLGQSDKVETSHEFGEAMKKALLNDETPE